MRLTILVTSEEANETRSYDGSEPIWIGRSVKCQVQVGAEHSSVSRQHACLRPTSRGWLVEDHSRVGTMVNGKRLDKEQQADLRVDDELRVGPITLRIIGLGHGIEQTLAREFQSVSFDVAALNPTVVLKSAMELPRLFGEANSEIEVLQKACDYLVEVMSPVVTSAYVIETDPHRLESSRILARWSPVNESTPVLSRRIIDEAIQGHGSIVFFNHISAKSIQATVQENTRTVGACLIEQSQGGDPVVIYIVGEKTLIDGHEVATGYLGLVSTLVRQHLVALRRAHLTNYFSPRVVELLMSRGGNAKAEGEPRIVEATSFFFDLRGFSLATEAAAADLLPIQHDLRQAMDVVAHEVFREDGTIIDYQGDGCFAAWGVPFEQQNQAQAAVDCALRISSRLRSTPLRAMAARSGSVCGIGIAKGEVLAGSVGSSEHFKYGLLGPSVNCASRVEALTKPHRLDAPVLVTEEVVRALDPAKTPWVRAARVGLAGTTDVVNLYEVLDGERSLSDPEHAAHWELLLATLETCRSLDDVRALIEQVPAGAVREDPRVRWLLDQAAHLTVPEHLARWDGVVRYDKG